MSNLKNKIFDQIKEKKVEPKGRWQFLLKDYVIWALFALSVVVGSLAFAIIILMVKTELSFAGTGLAVIPYFWLTVLIVFILIAYLNLSKTKVGYKINPYWWVVISILASMLLGSFIYILGWSTHIERGVYRNLPVYQKVIDHRMNVWVNPEEGRLMGEVRKIDNEHFELFAPNMQLWIVRYDSLDNQYESQRVRVLGHILAPQEFEAKEVFPMFGGGRNCEINECERKFFKRRSN